MADNCIFLGGIESTFAGVRAGVDGCVWGHCGWLCLLKEEYLWWGGDDERIEFPSVWLVQAYLGPIRNACTW